MQLPSKPRIPAHFALLPTEEGIRVCSDFANLLLTGSSARNLMPSLLPLLDGTRTPEEIQLHLFQEADARVVGQALELLHSSGLLEDAALCPPACLSEEEIRRYAPQTDFFARFSRDRYHYQARLKEAGVTLIGLGEVGRRVLQHLIWAGVGRIVLIEAETIGPYDLALCPLFAETDLGQPRAETLIARLAGLNPHVALEARNGSITSVADADRLLGSSDFTLCCAEQPRGDVFHWVNQACLNRGLRWLPVTVTAREALIGPAVIPHQTACYACLDLRRKSNLAPVLRPEAFERDLKGSGASPTGLPALFSALAAGLAALETIKVLTGMAYPVSLGNECVLNFFSLELSRHPVLRLPRCPACGHTRVQPSPKTWNI